MMIITAFMTLIVFVVTLLSCVSDVRSLRIPNWHSLVILGCFIPAWLATPGAFDGLPQHAAAMGVMFVVGYLMFSLGLMGGGDSKLATVLGLWVGLNGLAPFILSMAIAGGVVGLVSIIISKKKFFKNPLPGSWIEQVQAGRNAIPYGVAISIGAWAALSHTGFLHHQLDEVFNIIT
ncbi:MAG: prepilin peptidase [Alphaproteobacteria bacterium]|nr:prepilin peptidase [Alphaproteobacteria bacterium]